MDQKLILTDRDNYKLIVAGAAFFIFFSVYLTYSAAKFNALSTQSIVKQNVIMKVIQHNVKSICPKCGVKGIPMCPQCSVEMYWNGYRGNFICPSCGKGGFPQCPRCKSFMRWIEARR